VAAAQGFFVLISPPKARKWQNSLLFSLIAGNCRWRRVRIWLRTPPRIPAFKEISRRVAKRPELAAHAAGAWSLQTSGRIWEAVSARLSLAPEIPFPGGGACGRQRPGSNPELLGGRPPGRHDSDLAFFWALVRRKLTAFAEDCQFSRNGLAATAGDELQ
jgi:hypothetical protein